MKFLSIVLVSLAGSAIAKGNNKSANNGTLSTKAQCKQVLKYTELVDLANNQTKLDKATKNNATKADAIKAKASDAATSLSTLESNTTLMTACNQIFAVEDMQDDCDDMASMEKLAALVANTTALDAKAKNNATKIAAIQAKVSAQASTLAALQSNSTLTSFCAVESTKATCKKMVSMQKEIDLASNTTKLDKKFKNNSTKIAEYQAKVAKLQTKLTELQSNSTLNSTCESLLSTTAASTTNSGTTNNTSSGASSGAVDVKPVGAMVSLAALLFAGVLLL